MKKLLMSVAFIALVGSIVPADAASTFAIGEASTSVTSRPGQARPRRARRRRVRSPTGPPPTSVLVSRRPPRPGASRPASGRLRVKAAP